MRQAIGFPGGLVGCEGEDRALSDEVRGGVVLVQVCKNRRKRIARVQIHRGLRIFGVHEHHEVCVFGKESHLTLRVATVGAVRVGLDKLPNREAVGSFLRRDSNVFAHGYASSMAFGSRNASIPYWPYSRPTPEYLNPPQGACGSSVMPLITTRPTRSCEATRRARSTLVPMTAAWRPYLESFAMRMASSSDSYAMTLRTGPKISSCAIVISFFTLTNTVG